MMARVQAVEDALDDIERFVAEAEAEGDYFVDLNRATKWDDSELWSEE